MVLLRRIKEFFACDLLTDEAITGVGVDLKTFIAGDGIRNGLRFRHASCSPVSDRQYLPRVVLAFTVVLRLNCGFRSPDGYLIGPTFRLVSSRRPAKGDGQGLCT